METIQIIAVNRGNNLLSEELWRQLLKIEGGTFIRTSSSIEFQTKDNLTLIVDLNKTIEENDVKVIYSCSASDSRLPEMFVSRFKALQTQYIIGGLAPGSFNITVYHRQAIPLWQEKNNKNNGMKTQRLEGHQLAFLANAYREKLFPVPKTGQCLVKKDFSHDDFACFLYFDIAYHSELVDSINKHNINGSFALSNSEAKWRNLQLAIENAQTVVDIDFNDLKLYSISEDY